MKRLNDLPGLQQIISELQQLGITEEEVRAQRLAFAAFDVQRRAKEIQNLRRQAKLLPPYLGKLFLKMYGISTVCLCGNRKNFIAGKCRKCRTLDQHSVCPYCKGVKSPSAPKCQKCSIKARTTKLEDAQQISIEDIIEIYLGGGITLDCLAKMRHVTRERMRQILEKVKQKWSLDTMLGVDVKCGKKDAPTNQMGLLASSKAKPA